MSSMIVGFRDRGAALWERHAQKALKSEKQSHSMARTLSKLRGISHVIGSIGRWFDGGPTREAHSVNEAEGYDRLAAENYLLACRYFLD